MTAFMSYQYPPLPSSGPDIEDQDPTFMNNTHLPAIVPPPYPQSHGFTKPPSPSRNRAAAATSKNAKMRRSISSPNVRGQAVADAAALASAEKRRNKLGYHRTSVACSHCRRRKIRCIPAPGDAQSRCSNCIRLKRECIFLPVDSQQHTDASRRDSKAPGGLGRISSSSSPSSSQVEMPPPLPYQVPNVPQTQDVGGRSMKRPKTDDFASENKEYAIPAANWIQSEPSTIPKGPNDPSLPYWRVGNGHGSPVAPAYTQFTPPSQTPRHSNWSPSTVEPGQREQMGWGVPQRTMSYGSLEGLQHQPPFPTFHPAAGQGSLREVYSPKPGGHQSNAYSSVHTPSSMASDVNSRTITDVSAHASGPAQPPNYGTTQSWQSPYPYDKTSLPAPSTGVYTPWYNAGGVISSQPQSGPENTTSAAYSHPEAYNGMMYYAPTR